MILIVCDIDGTIADASRRFEQAGPEPDRSDKAKYNSWVSAVQTTDSLKEDPPVSGMPELITLLDRNAYLVYLTSREESWREVTEQWLQDNGFPRRPVIMRPRGSYVDSTQLKEISICSLLPMYNVEHVIVLDDDPLGTLSDMCARQGFTLLKAMSGGAKYHERKLNAA